MLCVGIYCDGLCAKRLLSVAFGSILVFDVLLRRIWPAVLTTVDDYGKAEEWQSDPEN
jgi:hypothetical protein